jgi:hypothetical protein
LVLPTSQPPGSTLSAGGSEVGTEQGSAVCWGGDQEQLQVPVLRQPQSSRYSESCWSAPNDLIYFLTRQTAPAILSMARSCLVCLRCTIQISTTVRNSLVSIYGIPYSPYHTLILREHVLDTWHAGVSDRQEQNDIQIQPLCSRCRTNQVLLLNYKANYFPEDEEVRVRSRNPLRTLTMSNCLGMTGP